MKSITFKGDDVSAVAVALNSAAENLASEKMFPSAANYARLAALAWEADRNIGLAILCRSNEQKFAAWFDEMEKAR